MNEQELFGRRVRAVRKATKLSREKAAEKAHMNSNYLGEIERGEKWPSLEKINGLAKALNVSPSIFFEFEREETDERVLRKKIEALLNKCNSQQLQYAHNFLKYVIEP